MKIFTKKIFSYLVIVILFSGSAVAQDVNRIIEALEEGEIFILNNTEQKIDNNGDKVKLVKYQAITIANVSIQNCLKVLKQTSFQKDFIYNALKAEKVKTNSDDEWLNYYLFSGACKMPSYDCVLKMKYFGSNNNKSFAITGTACPFLIEDKGVDRIESYKITCAVRELNDDKVEISLFAEFIPIFSAPDWRIKMGYPNPAKLLEGIICMADNL